MTLLVAGCGGGSIRARPAVCKLKAQEAVARDLGVHTDDVAYAKSIANNGMPQCAFKARPGGRKVVVTVNVDNGPQPYFRMLRTVDEATQIFGVPPPGFHAPVGVSGLGPFASWFPNQDHLMATNYELLLTATVAWPHSGQGAQMRLARAAITPYFGHLRNAAKAKSFP
ncbi:MAG TPA: hypothetical protein VHX66_05485 [Solirubrobacteraceae bacterium]|nr:hypothetical protein [Solirubrobacteraceae bacterium]